jgi:hypothetical protein
MRSSGVAEAGAEDRRSRFFVATGSLSSSLYVKLPMPLAMSAAQSSRLQLGRDFYDKVSGDIWKLNAISRPHLECPQIRHLCGEYIVTQKDT